jgi:hypothetical protein
MIILLAVNADYIIVSISIKNKLKTKFQPILAMARVPIVTQRCHCYLYPNFFHQRLLISGCLFIQLTSTILNLLFHRL